MSAAADSADLSPAERLSDQLGDFQLNSEGSVVWATITDITEIGQATEEPQVKVTAELPDGQEFSETFDYPIPWRSGNRFCRLVENQGYDPSSLHFMEDEKTRVYKHPLTDEWRFYVDRSDRFWSIPLLDVTINPDVVSLKVWAGAMTLSTLYLSWHHLPSLGLMLEFILIVLPVIMLFTIGRLVMTI